MSSAKSIITPILLVGSAIAFFVAVWAVAQFYLGQLRLSPEVVYGGALPDELKLLSSFQTEDGITADLYHKLDHTKVGFAFSSPAPTSEKTPISGAELIRALLVFQSSRQVDPRLTSFSTRYAGAQFEPRRAFDVTPVDIELAGTHVPCTQFRSTGEWNHLLGVVNLPNGQLAFQAVRKNAQVDPETVKRIISHEIEVSQSWKFEPR